MIPIESFELDTYDIRRHARENPERGAVTVGYEADPVQVVDMLNDALATILVSALRYRQHHFVARGLFAGPVRDAFLVHADQECGHLDQLAGRIVELNGQPDFEPNPFLGRSPVQYTGESTLVDMIHENLVSERVAIDTLRAMIGYLAGRDTTTRRVLESILAIEERHARDLADLLADRPSNTIGSAGARIGGNGRRMSFDPLDPVREQAPTASLTAPDWP